MRRLLSAALAALIASMPMSYSLADATPSAIAEEEPSSTEELEAARAADGLAVYDAESKFDRLADKLLPEAWLR